MKNSVILKGNRYGISIVLDPNAEFSKILADLTSRLENAEAFFDSDRQLAVAFEGRVLTNGELEQILTVIEEHSQLNIQYVVDENSDLEATFFDIMESEENHENTSLEQTMEITEVFPDESDLLTEVIPVFQKENETSVMSDSTGMFYKGTLRSGQTLEAKESLVVIGDVNPGASIIAGGNVIVIGALKGNVTAGANGNSNAFVMALSMEPIQIQIADVIARNSDHKRKVRIQKESMIAMVEGSHIVMKPVSKASLQKIDI